GRGAPGLERPRHAGAAPQASRRQLHRARLRALRGVELVDPDTLALEGHRPEGREPSTRAGPGGALTWRWAATPTACATSAGPRRSPSCARSTSRRPSCGSDTPTT